MTCRLSVERVGESDVRSLDLKRGVDSEGDMAKGIRWRRGVWASKAFIEVAMIKRSPDEQANIRLTHSSIDTERKGNTHWNVDGPSVECDIDASVIEAVAPIKRRTRSPNTYGPKSGERDY